MATYSKRSPLGKPGRNKATAELAFMSGEQMPLAAGEAFHHRTSRPLVSVTFDVCYEHTITLTRDEIIRIAKFAKIAPDEISG